MLKRYLTIIITFVVLVGMYLIFFHDRNSVDKEYAKYYEMLINREEFIEDAGVIDILIPAPKKDGDKYQYSISFVDAKQRLENVKIMILDSSVKKEDKIKMTPNSFGIINNKGYTFDVKEAAELDPSDNVLAGGAFNLYDKDKVDYFIIYLSFNNQELFIKIVV